MIEHGDKVKIAWFAVDYIRYDEDGKFPVYTFNKKEDGLWELTDKHGATVLINPLNPNIQFIGKLTGDQND